MPHYQCPRCGGTESFGQWEQRLNNRSVTYYDNLKQPVGSSNNGFSVSNVRQQYCVSCVSVKMDFRLSAEDMIFIGNLLRGIVKLITATVRMAFRLITRIAPYSLIAVLFGALFLAIQDLDRQLPNWYVLVNVSVGVALYIFIEIYRKFKIKKQDKMFLRDRFYDIKSSTSRKRSYWYAVIVLALINITYLYQLQNM